MDNMSNKDKAKLAGLTIWKYSWIGRKWGGRGTFDRTSQVVWGTIGTIFISLFVFLFWLTHQF